MPTWDSNVYIWSSHTMSYIVRAYVYNQTVNKLPCVLCMVAFLARKFSLHHKVLCWYVPKAYVVHVCWHTCSCVCLYNVHKTYKVLYKQSFYVYLIHHVSIFSFICVLLWHLSNSQAQKFFQVLSWILFYLCILFFFQSYFCFATRIKIT